MPSIHELLEAAIRAQASDLVIKAGARPAFRVNGAMVISELPVTTPEETRELAFEIMFSSSRDTLLQYPASDGHGVELEDADARMKELEQKAEVDLVFTIPRQARVRANLFMQRGTIGAALRLLPLQPYTIEELGLPPILNRMALEPQGLIIITGPTGSGKTTTMAAILEEINRKRAANVFTIEEPIEYVFQDKRSVIHQREVGLDTRSFEAALRSVMRQSPDVVAIGELRDRETMDVAMTAAEIGHLVITTLHTTSAAATIDRIVNSFPQQMKQQVCQQLEACLLCVTSQRLVDRDGGQGRIAAVEVMTNSPMVRKLLLEGETSDLQSCIRDGSHFGMNTMNQALERLVQSKTVTVEEAVRRSSNQTEFRQLIRRR